MPRTTLLLTLLLLGTALAAAQDTAPPDPIATLEVTTGKSPMVVAWQNTGRDDAVNWSALGTVVYAPTQSCNSSEEVIRFDMLRSRGPLGGAERGWPTA